MPQGMEEQYYTMNQMVQPNLTNQPKTQNQAQLNWASALSGIRPQPQMPYAGPNLIGPGAGGQTIQNMQNQIPQGNTIAGMQQGLPGQPGGGGMARGFGNTLEDIQGPFNPAYNSFSPNPIQGEQSPRRPHVRDYSNIVPPAEDIMNTIQPVGQPQLQQANPAQGVIDRMMGFFQANPQTASAVFGEGGLPHFQQMLNGLFQARPQRGTIQGMTGQVSQLGGGSALQGLKRLFTARG